MTERRCINPQCDRELSGNSPSLYYCSFFCSIAIAERATGSSGYWRSSYGALAMDPTSWASRSASPQTAGANVSDAFPWLDVRAAQ